MTQYSIGTFPFITLVGEPVAPRQTVDEPIVRPGINGVGIWRTGRRGRVFTLRSKVDHWTRGSARVLFYLYRQLIGYIPVALVIGNYDFNAQEKWKVVVLDVTAVAIDAHLTSVGGLNPPGLGWLEADWKLIAIENP